MEKAEAMRAEGRALQVRLALARAKEAAPRSASVRRALGLALREAGEWHEAVQELLSFRRLTGDRGLDPVIADCYRREGKTSRARDFLAELDRSTVSAAVWADAEVVRAGSFLDEGRADMARNLLERALRETRSPAAVRQLKSALEVVASER